MKNKTITVDGYNLGLDKGTGISTYARNLTHQIHNLGYRTSVLYGAPIHREKDSILEEIGFFDGGLDYSNTLTGFFFRRFGGWADFLGRSAFEVNMTDMVEKRTFMSKLPYFDQLLNSHTIFDRAHRNFNRFGNLLNVKMNQHSNLMHWTYSIPAYAPGIPNLYTLHDLIPLKLPYTTLDNKRKYYKLIQKVIKRADRIITVSEWSKKDIHSMFDVPDEKVINTYQSVHIPEKYANLPEENVMKEIEGVFAVPYKNYFLFFGSIEPKKNLARLIEAYLSLDTKTKLVIVGALAWKSKNELNLLKNIRNVKGKRSSKINSNRVIQLEYVSFPLLVSLIKGAKAVSFPSIYEGFGLPILEGMYLGTPVLTSNEASIPEIAGDAAVMVDAYDPKSIAEGMHLLDTDETLRNELVIKGKAQADKYSEDVYAEKLKSLYAEMV